MDEYNLAHLLSKKGLNSLLFTDPYSKLCFTSILAKEVDIVYLDFDTTFSAYLKAGIIQTRHTIDVYLPSEGKFLEMMQDVLLKIENSHRQPVVIFDSINSFYTMYYRYYYHHHHRHIGRKESALGRLNHLLAVLLMILVRQGVTLGVPVLATSMLRFRNIEGWKQSPASRRLLQQKSAARFEVSLAGENNLRVTVLAHESIPEGTSFSFDVTTALC